jgi:hypothetical protein
LLAANLPEITDEPTPAGYPVAYTWLCYPSIPWHWDS